MKTIATLLMSLLLVIACESQEPSVDKAMQTDAVPIVAAEKTNPCRGIGITQIDVSPTLPAYFPATGLQIAANCLAWQEFIYLNWQSDPQKPGYPNKNIPAASFGSPLNISSTVWESYREASQVFAGTNDWSSQRSETKTLTRLSKLGDADINLHSIGQAGDNKWITDQRGGLAYYEVRLNEDEYDYITQNIFDGSDLTTYAGQLACVTQAGNNGRGGLGLPAGQAGGHSDVDCTGQPATYGQNVGAIEIKASWIALPSDGSLNYRYKIAKAEITQPGGQTSSTTVGLTGLHIIHKMPGANQFVWATFEQIDNTPDNNSGNPGAPDIPRNPNQKPYTTANGPYTFYSNNCDTSQDKVYNCKTNVLPGNPCAPNVAANGCYPYSAPMQLTRITPVDEESNLVTGYVWSLLPADSVFNYYRLIDVQWPNTPSPVKPGSTVPLSAGDIRPADATRIVSNSTLETYQQKKNSCMDCHKFASIAHPAQQQSATIAGLEVRRVFVNKPHAEGTPNYASDYSFLFSTETIR